MPTFSTMELTMLSVSTCCFALLTALSVLSSYLWYQVADRFWMKPRWSKWQIYALSIICVLYIGGSCPLRTWRYVWIKDPSKEHNGDNSTRTSLYLVSVIVRLFLILFAIIVIFTRLWLTYFDANLCLELAALEWKQLIDPRQRGARSNWFVANQNTWGSRSHVLKVTTLLTVMLLTVFGVVTVLNFDLVNLVFLFVLISMAIWLALFAKKYPAFRDSIHLREEANAMKWVVGVYVVVFLIWNAAFYLIEAKDDSVAYVLTVCISQIVSALFFLAYQLAIVNYVTSFFEKPYLVVCGIPVLFDLHSKDCGEGMRVEMVAKTQALAVASDKRVSLRTVLRHDIGCRLLMSHLLSELSHENLLALMECVKFRERMAVVCGVQLAASDQLRAANLFGTEVNDTQSSLVAALQSPTDIPHVYAAFCLKYVATASPTTVNMSYSTRRDAQRLMDAGSELDPFSLDPIIRECVFHLRSSFSRFSRTEEYAKFVEEFGDGL